MFELVIAFKDAGKFDNFKDAFWEMCTKLQEKMPKGAIAQEIVDTSWIEDKNAGPKSLNTFDLKSAIKRAEKERIISKNSPLIKNFISRISI